MALPLRIGRYEIIGTIGHGGMATVYLATDPYTKRHVALKILPQHTSLNTQFRLRFQREARIIAQIDHPGIVPIFDVGEHETNLFLVMRYMAGGSLANRLKNGPLQIPEMIALFKQIAPTLDEVHTQGIIHRDLKPDNILFDDEGKAYLADFGIAKFAEATISLTGDRLVGTPAYMSPEQVQGRVELDGRSDIYSLGVILFELLTGQQPFQGTSPLEVAIKHVREPIPRLSEFTTELSPSFQDLIEKAMAKDREERFDSGEAFLSELISAINIQLTTPTAVDNSSFTPTTRDHFPKPLNSYSSQPKRGMMGVILASIILIGILSMWAMMNTSILSLTGNATLSPTEIAGMSSQEGTTTQDSSRFSTPSLTVQSLVPTAMMSPTALPSPSFTPTSSSTTIPLPPIQPLMILQEEYGQGTLANIDVSPDGNTLALATTMGIQLYNTNSLESVALLSLPSAQKSFRRVVFSPNGDLLAASTYDELRFWDLTDNKIINTITIYDRIQNIAWSPDGALLALALEDTSVDPKHSIKLVDVPSGDEVSTFATNSVIIDLAWSPDGNYLLLGAPNEVGVTNIHSGEPALTFPLEGNHTYNVSVDWSPDSTMVAAGIHNFLYLWNTVRGEGLFTIEGHQNNITDIAWSPDGSVLASGGSDGIKLWNVENGQEVGMTEGNLGSLGRQIKWLPDGSGIISMIDQVILEVWKPASGQIEAIPTIHTRQVLGIAGDVENKLFIFDLLGSNIVRMWDISKGELLRTWASTLPLIQTVSLSPDGSRVVWGTWEGSVEVGYVSEVEGDFDLGLDLFTISDIEWSPDSQYLAVGGYGGNVYVWDMLRRQRIYSINDNTESVNSVAWSPDATMLASGGADKTVRIWNMENGEEQFKFESHVDRLDVGRFENIAWAPDGSKLAALEAIAGSSTNIYIWDINSGELLYLSDIPDSAYYSGLAWAPDSINLAISSHSGTIILDTRKWEVLQILRSNSAFGGSLLLWSPDGSHLASVSRDGRVQIWRLED